MASSKGHLPVFAQCCEIILCKMINGQIILNMWYPLLVKHFGLFHFYKYVFFNTM